MRQGLLGALAVLLASAHKGGNGLGPSVGTVAPRNIVVGGRPRPEAMRRLRTNLTPGIPCRVVKRDV